MGEHSGHTNAIYGSRIGPSRHGLARTQVITVEEFEECPEDEGLSDEVVENFRRNCVTGAAFLQLTEDDLRELVPLIGERTVVRELLK